MCRVRSLLLAGALALLPCASLPAAEALPAGAVARLGTLHFWHPGVVNAAAFSPDGKTIATACQDRVVRLWDAATGREVHRLKGHTNVAYALAFSPNGKLLAWGNGGATVHVWDWEARREARAWQQPFREQVAQLTFAPDGSTLAWAALSGRVVPPPGLTVRLTDTSTGMPLRELDGHGGLMAPLGFSPDGRMIVMGADSGVRLWEAATGKIRLSFRTNLQGVQALAFRPVGRVLATAGLQDSAIRFWDTASGRQLSHIDFPGGVTALAWVRGGQALVTANADGTAMVWDAKALPRGGLVPTADPEQAELEALWADLLGSDAGRAYRALGRLASAPKAAVPFVEKRLRTTGAGGERKRIAGLIADLDSDEFAKRERAEQELGKLGRRAEEALRKALEGEASTEARRRINLLLKKLEKDPLPRPAAPADEVVAAVRAVELLEWAGTDEARQALEKLAKGTPEEALTREAKAALGRMKGR